MAGNGRVPSWKIRLDAWFVRHAGQSAPESLVQEMDAAITKMMKRAEQRGRRVTRTQLFPMNPFDQ